MKKVVTVLNKNQNKNYPDGDFRSLECIELLKEVDIVVTNPPFSLWREFLAQLMEYDKKFLILGNQTAISFKEVFPFLKENKIWIGASCKSVSFKTSFSLEPKKFGNIRWFTNLKLNYKVKPLDLSKNHYTPEKYPKYDNYDAINVDKVADIPCDYPGIMGVPVSFMDKYCPEQFEIVGFFRDTALKKRLVAGCLTINSKLKYARIFIKNQHPEWSKQNAGFKPA